MPASPRNAAFRVLASMMMLNVSRRMLATSPHPAAEGFRRVLRSARAFSIPAPRLLFRPVLHVLLVVRTVYYFLLRVFICEPLFKAYCREYGPNLHTGVYLHWIRGRGDIIVGHDVLFDGKTSITFAARYCDNPTLRVGDYTEINHNVTLVVGREITIGSRCLVASGVAIFDVNGHPADPNAREHGAAPAPEDVRPVRIADNVWIGRNAIVHPGVTIGEGSIVSAGAVVMSDLPPMSIAAGNPARKIGVLS
jgi:acetyltransferase-like isoleucine patch superfamily enzyme